MIYMNRWTLKNYSRREDVRRIAEMQEKLFQDVQKEQKQTFKEIKNGQESLRKDI